MSWSKALELTLAGVQFPQSSLLTNQGSELVEEPD